MTDKKLIEIRDELAKSYPSYYELIYMNSDTPRLSGSEYLQHGYKAGFDKAVELMQEREKIAVEALSDLLCEIAIPTTSWTDHPSINYVEVQITKSAIEEAEQALAKLGIEEKPSE